MPAYLTGSDLPRDLQAVLDWRRPDEVSLRAELDLAADRLIVQLELRGLSLGLSLGGARVAAADVRYMLDETCRTLTANVAARLVRQARPDPAWYQQAVDQLARWQAHYQPWAGQAAAQLLRDVDVPDMPDCQVLYRLSGIPRFVWSLGGRSLWVEVHAPRKFRYAREGGGEPKCGGVVEIDAPTQLRELMLWLRGPVAPGLAP
jgi:hypothetical protein